MLGNENNNAEHSKTLQDERMLNLKEQYANFKKDDKSDEICFQFWFAPLNQ